MLTIVAQIVTATHRAL